MIVTNSATQLLGKSVGRSSVSLRNGSEDITISHKTGVTAGQTDGALLIKADEPFTLSGTAAGLPLYAVTTSGTSDVSILISDVSALTVAE